ncbi:MAG: PspC domain-containing protein [Prolixibacteraceae bacterium]|nr:PspC domain-containing protein [Prolixibacteraceae bacterium]
MKKKLTINIRGIVFHIDEDAYDKLKTYLSKLYSHFNKEEGGAEIVNDIESRIAELFSERINENRKVVDFGMVENIIEIIGMPEDIARETNTGETADNGSSSKTYHYQSRPKRLYRDPESTVIGGVCSGLSYFLNLDKALVRVLFVVVFLITSGLALFVYLILWIAVPLARTTSQKFEMKGESINVENIGKTVKDDVSATKESTEKSRPDYIRRDETNSREGKRAGSVLAGILGVFFIVVSLLGIMGLIAGIVLSWKAAAMLPVFVPGLHGATYFNFLFTYETFTALMFSSLLVAGIPLLMIMYAGTKMLFNYKSNSRVIVLTALGFWILGIIIAIGSTVGAIGKLSSNATLKEKQKIDITSDTIYVEIDEEKYAGFYESKIELNNAKVLTNGNDEILVIQPLFDVEKSRTGETEMVFAKQARGKNYDKARIIAEKIESDVTIAGNRIILNPWFEVGKKDKWRSQSLDLTLMLPEGKVVYFNENLLPVMDNIDNNSGLWKGDMTCIYLKMEPKGLTCTTE